MCVQGTVTATNSSYQALGPEVAIPARGAPQLISTSKPSGTSLAAVVCLPGRRSRLPSWVLPPLRGTASVTLKKGTTVKKLTVKVVEVCESTRQKHQICLAQSLSIPALAMISSVVLVQGADLHAGCVTNIAYPTAKDAVESQSQTLAEVAPPVVSPRLQSVLL